MSKALHSVLLVAALASAPAHAASLDLLEVGGLWGTPTATGATAVWWNPGAMSGGKGTRFLFELAPTIGGVNFERDDPGYGGLETDFGGEDSFTTVQPIPFIGVVSDFGVPGIGIGIAGFVPMGRGGLSSYDPGPGRTHLREAQILPLHASLAVSYGIPETFGVGGAVTYVYGSWSARLDNETVTQLADFAGEVIPGLDPTLLFQDADAEDPATLAQVNFGPLQDHRVSFQAGIWAKPHEKVTLSLGYAFGTPTNHKGPTSITLGCSENPAVRPLLESRGLCDATVRTDTSSIAYRYPMRAHLGIALEPVPDVSVELMAGWVGWSAFSDFEIKVSDLEAVDTEISEEDLGRVEQDRLWARDNRDSFWVGIDTKGKVHEQVLVGGRVLFDRAAVPSYAMSPNNADFDTIQLGALIAAQPSKKVPLEIGLSFTEHIQMARTVTDSAFSVSVDPDARPEDRYTWPSMNGRYTGFIHRLGISVRGTFEDKPKRLAKSK